MNVYEDGLSLWKGLDGYFRFYNHERPHQSLSYKTPANGYSNEIQFSLDSLNSNTLKKLLNVNSEYSKKIIHSILCADKEGFNIRVNTVITSLNFDKNCLKLMCEELNELSNSIEWEIRVFMPSLYLEKEINDKLSITDDNTRILHDFIDDIIKPMSKHKVVFFDNTKFNPEKLLSANSDFDWICSANNSSLFILPDGKVTICEQLYWHPKFIIGDINNNSIGDICNSDKALYLASLYNNIKEEKGICAKCNFNHTCFTKSKCCWINVLKYNGIHNWLNPDPNCIKINQNN